MIKISKNRISASEEKTLFQKYNVLGKVLEKNLSDDDLKKTLKLRDRIRTKIVENNTGLVYKHAHKCKPKTYTTNLEFDDLVQFGMIGLLKSIDGYDFNSGYYFSTYASKNIELTIYRYINTTSRTVKIPEKELMKFLKHIKETKNQETLVTPMELVIINSLFGESNSEEEIVAIASARTPIDDLDDKLIRHDIEKLISSLPERDKTVVYHYFGVCGKKQMTVKELGDFMGYSKKTIYTLVENVCEKLKKRKHMMEGWEDYEEG
jgi:RNA polymerase primary sigma factor